MSDSDDQEHPLNLVIYWHMHQPEYRNLDTGEYHLPWTYLHTIKDYVDMAAHLEDCEQARAVVNFAPVLLEQIDDYSQQLSNYLHYGRDLRDPLMAALANSEMPQGSNARIHIIRSCLRANEERLINRFKPFKKLAAVAKSILVDHAMVSYYTDQFLADLLVWYHLSWIAETVRRQDSRVKTLMKKGGLYTPQDRRLLIELMHELISGVIGRYRHLAEQGRIELSMTPYAHPIVPLLLDIKSAEQAMPDVTLPEVNDYPGGKQRSQWHMKKGVEVFKKHFGFPPQGCWPSEGSISGEMVELLSDMNIKWMASGETVLRNSLSRSNMSDSDCRHQTYQYRDTSPSLFFRDDGLSDLIGFKYSDWHADDAIANLIRHLEDIHESCKDKPEAIVSIILDGENAWEYYPENAYYFLSTLYKKLSENKGIRMTTYSEYLLNVSNKTTLPELVAGSWVYGTFSTWIGERDKNTAWEMLIAVKQVYDRVMAEDNLSLDIRKRAEMQLATCESSDWFWWFGEYNSAESVASFDKQYRMHLANLYQIMDEPAPAYLHKAFSFGSGDALASGTMLPGKKQ
ncbi:MAG: glycoside hydrolase [Gammaproteobacteria bacterium]|nr:glycoside hydrolase [Gammaproteobacteria bacterium]